MATIALPTTTIATNLSTVEKGTSSIAIPCGNVVYKNASNLLDIAVKTAAGGKYGAIGVLVSTAEAANQVVTFAGAGAVITVSGLAAGVAYYLSSGGDVCLFADLVAGDRVVLVGIARSTTSLYLICYDTGITL